MYNGLDEDFLALFHHQTFLQRFSWMSTAWEKDLREDVKKLKLSSKEKVAIFWREERGALEEKNLNFMNFSSYVSVQLIALENSEYKILDKSKLLHLNDIKTRTKQLLGSISEVKYMFHNLNRIIDLRESISISHGSEKVENSLKLLGVLGGVAAILAATFAGGIPISLRFIAIAVIIFAPLIYFIFNKRAAKLKRRRTRKYYLQTKILETKRGILTIEEQKHFIESEKSVGEAVKKEMVETYLDRLGYLQNEVKGYEDELRKI
jgi:hypothetical protein